MRRWVESGLLLPDASQSAADHSSYYFRRDRVEQVRVERNLETIPASTEEWKQEFLDFAKSRNLSRSYKPVMLKALFSLVDREATFHIFLVLSMPMKCHHLLVEKYKLHQPLYLQPPRTP
ncbi:MAG TPA: hypothetical protein VGD98_12195 [Ktedonobacteraceae bacterium]